MKNNNKICNRILQYYNNILHCGTDRLLLFPITISAITTKTTMASIAPKVKIFVEMNPRNLICFELFRTTKLYLTI